MISSDFDRYTIPNVGLALIIRNNGKVLLQKRKGSHSSGTWAFPGGHLELWESVEGCALRELKEEAGDELIVKDIKTLHFTNDMFKEDRKHFITLFLVCDYVSGNPKIAEPEKCEGWEWHSWESLPKPLMLPIENMIQEGLNPFEK